ncbi:hypothetical protein CTI14_49240, partial [Methylobacterium radiotolerans]
TGIISGKIDHSASQLGGTGVHTITVTATDNAGLTTTQTFKWRPRPSSLTRPASIRKPLSAWTCPATSRMWIWPPATS